jgi:glyoxylase-like metal-dependent hydrolase (beta-lactamase superfamily II)
MTYHTVPRIIVGDIATNCWIYPLDESGAGLPPGFQGCAIIDPGAEAERIIARLNQLKLVPHFILLTHGHFDHIAALPALVAAYRGADGTGPLTAIHRGDAEYLGAGAFDVHCRSFSAAAGSAAYVQALWEDIPPPDQTFADGDTLGPFTALHLPGHTPGSAGFWDRKTKTLFSGDTLFRGDYGRTDLPGGSEAELSASLRRLCAMDGEITVCPGHGPVTSIGEEARRFRHG